MQGDFAECLSALTGLGRLFSCHITALKIPRSTYDIDTSKFDRPLSTKTDLQTQILPYLQSFTVSKDARKYLEDFLGPHNREAQTFIDSYIQQHFKKPSAPSTPARGPTPVEFQKKQPTLPKLKDADVIANLSPTAKETLKKIDHTLEIMSAKPDSKLVQKSRCFCQCEKRLD
jgi:hypothetical protein